MPLPSVATWAARSEVEARRARIRKLIARSWSTESRGGISIEVPVPLELDGVDMWDVVLEMVMF